MNFFLSAIKILLIFYLVIVAGMVVFQRKFLYFPSKDKPSLENFKGVYQEIKTQTKDKLQLTHWHAKQGLPYFVILHGNAGNIENRAHKFDFLTDQGHSVLLVSYRGYGDNPGRPTEADLISDSAVALEWLAQKTDLNEVILIGESLGSGTAIALAAQYPVKGLILDSSYSSVSDVAKTIYPWIPVAWLLKDTWDSLSRIQNVKVPIFFIHAKQDSVLPFRLAKKLFEASPGPKKHLWLEGERGHNDNFVDESTQKALFDFVQSL